MSACTTLPDTTPPDVDGAGTGGGLSGGSAGASAGTTGGTDVMAGTGGATGGGAGVGGTAGSGAGTGGAASGAGGATGGAGTGGDGGTAGGAGALGGAGAGGTGAGMGGSSGKGGSGGAQAGGGSGGASGKGGSGGAGAPNGGAGAGGKGGAGAGGAGASSGGKGGTGMGGNPTELANGRPTTADSEEDNSQMNLASHGNDGMTGTRWCAADGMPHYWQVDLGAVHLLQRVEIEFEYPTQADGFPYGYVVTVSSDGTTFGPGIDQSANASTTPQQSAMFPANTMGRHVRILVTPPVTTPSPTWASFWEARIYGY